MPTYEQNKESIKRYMEKVDIIRITTPKESGIKEAVTAHAKACGESVNAFVIRAIMEAMEREKGKE